ncbi:MAG TPA: nucleoside-diphosphate sugar epimerase/dehydratase [Abditibacteriaceae bacterium]|jgi:FlaA1/EpsC-like NDP-sugar epimerase
MGTFAARKEQRWPYILMRRTHGLIGRVLRVKRIDHLKIAMDGSLMVIAASWAWLVSFGQVRSPGSPIPFLFAVLAARFAIYFCLQLHRTSWLHVSRFEVFWLGVSALLGPPFIAAILWILPEPFTLQKLTRPEIILSTEPAFYLLLLFGARMTARAISYNKRPEDLRRVLIIGAGDAGRALAYQIQESQSPFEIVGFLDDDERKAKRKFRGLSVRGTIDQLCEVVGEHEVQEIVVAIVALAPEKLRTIIALSENCGIPVRILPPLREVIGGRPDFRALREVRMEDLLPRPEINLDRAALSTYLGGRTVLITGGGGSIGGELCRQVLAAGAKRLLILGRGENSVFEITQELKEQKSACELVPIICDVRDRAALTRIWKKHRPDAVFHAAAHKHVPLMEQYPGEAVKNNVVGTLNVVRLAVEFQTEHFVMVSTDKAVEPTSVMGATKRIGEMIVKAHAMQSGLNMVCVRFGNVLGSRGSVVPTMTRQIRLGQPVTITDPEMVRYFMTIPEAVQLILQAGALGGNGEVFVLDMGQPVRILDLAHDLIRLSGLVPHQDIPIRIIGKRPGEKMYEDLLTNAESEGVEKRGPFFCAPSQHVDLAALNATIEELEMAALEGDDEAAVEIIHRFVPEARFARLAENDTNGHHSNGHETNGHQTNGHHANGHHEARGVIVQ